MGYTHYWAFRKPERKKGAMADAEKKYKKAIIDCQRIAVKYNKDKKTKGLDWERLSGFAAHCKPGTYGGLKLNGKGSNAHEDFCMREHLRDELGLQHKDRYGYGRAGSNFCKTARKPYDVVVTACLAVLKYHLGDLISISSDGTHKDWNDGVILARDVLRRKIENPIPKEEALPNNVIIIGGK